MMWIHLHYFRFDLGARWFMRFLELWKRAIDWKDEGSRTWAVSKSIWMLCIVGWTWNEIIKIKSWPRQSNQFNSLLGIPHSGRHVLEFCWCYQCHGTITKLKAKCRRIRGKLREPQIADIHACICTSQDPSIISKRLFLNWQEGVIKRYINTFGIEYESLN